MKNPIFNCSKLNTLTELRDGMGYWVYVSAGGILEVQGTPVDHNTTAISLRSGWNYVGFPLQSSKNIRTAMTSLLGANANLSRVINRGLEFDPDKSDEQNTLLQLQPGRGYWIKVNQNQEFNYQ